MRYQQGDLINELLQTPDANRDDRWREGFFENVIDASFQMKEPPVIQGPDGFPYLALHSPDPYKGFEAFCICNLIEYVNTDGFGIVINPGLKDPGWVFTYGELLTYRMFGVFEVKTGKEQRQSFEKHALEREEQVLIGQPSEEFLPGVARVAIKRFLKEGFGVSDLGVFLMFRKEDNPPSQLVFSLFPDDFSNEEEFAGVFRAISWFLPRHYPVVTLPRESSLVKDFLPL